MSNIRLSEKSVSYIVKLCKRIQIGNPGNQQSFDMADGIANYVQTRRYVSQKQAEWLCRNCEYWKIKRPAEFSNITLNGSKEKSQQSHGAEMTPQPAGDVLNQLLRRMKRIERLLKSRLPL